MSSKLRGGGFHLRVPNVRADVLVAVAMAFVIGFALGYAVRAAISFGRRRAAKERRYSI
jgi:NhaP-type Na+/H+ or K+/H+ antiporter